MTPPPDRRGFLRRFGAGLAVAPTSPLAAVFVSGDLFVNQKLGIALRKPPGWRFEHLSTFADLRNEYEYATLDDALRQMLAGGPLPIVVLSQAPVLRQLCASATVYAEEDPIEPDSTLEAVASEVVRGVSSFVRDFRLTADPACGRLDGAESLAFTGTFVYEDRLGHCGPVRHRSLVLRKPPFLYTLNMLDIPAEGIDAQREFDAVRDSVVLG